MRNVHVNTNGVPSQIRDAVTDAIRGAVGGRQGKWEASVAQDPKNNAWDVEINGPNHFHRSRRFSGADRDPDVISAAINEALPTGKAA